MKIYNKVVMDMSTGEILEEDSFEYDGPLALCGGGGSSSGEVDYPEYMKTQHHHWLNNVNTEMDWGKASNPYGSLLPHNPADEIANMDNKWQYYYNTVVAMLNESWTLGPAAAMITAFTTKLNDDIDTVILPRFSAAMFDINAVQSSAYGLGHALIEAKKLSAVSEFAADVMMKSRINNTEHLKAMTHLGIEIERLAIIANSEYRTRQTDQAALGATWNLEMYKYGCNVLASIAGAAIAAGTKGVSPGASALGGAASGAAAGAMIGASYGSTAGWYGAAAGAVIGGAAGYFSAR